MDREYFKNPKGKPEYSSGCFWFWNDKIEVRAVKSAMLISPSERKKFCKLW